MEERGTYSIEDGGESICSWKISYVTQGKDVHIIRLQYIQLYMLNTEVSRDIVLTQSVTLYPSEAETPSVLRSASNSGALCIGLSSSRVSAIDSHTQH